MCFQVRVKSIVKMDLTPQENKRVLNQRKISPATKPTEELRRLNDNVWKTEFNENLEVENDINIMQEVEVVDISNSGKPKPKNAVLKTGKFNFEYYLYLITMCLK